MRPLHLLDHIVGASVGGIVTPNALAVFKLMTRFEFGGLFYRQIVRVGAVQHLIYNSS